MTPEPAELLARLLEHLAGLPPDLAAWLETGLTQYIDGEPLERALGLRTGKAGARTARTRLRLTMRDQRIVRAWRETPGANSAVKARNLLNAIHALPRLRGEPASLQSRLLIEAAAYGDLPESRNGILNIVENPANHSYSLDALAINLGA